MIPIRDRAPAGGPARVTHGLIGANVVFFLASLAMGADGFRFVLERFGFTPALFSSGAVLGPASDFLTTPLTSMFLHGDVLHLVSNLWFLHIFGDNVEHALGRARYLAFYVVSGLAACTAQLLVEPASLVPMIGASGAISGVLGAYLVLFPRARIVVLVPIVIIASFFEWPAWLVVGEWFVVQVVSGLRALTSDSAAAQGGVAWFAHIGGFLAGLLGARLLSQRSAEKSSPFDTLDTWR